MILIIDFGSQTAHLIGRRLRSLGVPVEYADPEDALPAIKLKNPKGIILSGGPNDISHDASLSVDKQIFELKLPVLGICYGWQLMAHLLGGAIKHSKKEYGPEFLKVVPCDTARYDLVKSGIVIMSHGDTVTKLPKGFTAVGSTKQVRFAAVIHEKKKFFGVQFHPEANHTEHGIVLLKNFAVDVCCETLSPLVVNPNEIIHSIKKSVGANKVICAVSGGVDSTVAAFLIGKAIGNNLIPVHVESGLMRPETEKRVRRLFANSIVIRARKRFMAALRGITDPEIKRKTIGKLYVDIFQEQAAKHANATFLGQGTIYSDVIESKGSKHASHIKSHHNVGGLPKNMKLTLLEPLRNYYKDEVREIGRRIGLPMDVVQEQVFPGPGYAVRIRGEVTIERLEQIKRADQIVIEEMKKAKLYDTTYMCFAIMTGACSTAVKGDSRVFAEVIAIRSVNSQDVMTSEWTRIPHDVLHVMAARIVNEVPNISRVVYDITTKPPATMEWE